jgi:hypothetical protein
MGNVLDLRISEDAGIKRHGLFGLIVKPQAWSDFLNASHDVSPSRCQSRMALRLYMNDTLCYLRKT